MELRYLTTDTRDNLLSIYLICYLSSIHINQSIYLSIIYLYPSIYYLSIISIYYLPINLSIYIYQLSIYLSIYHLSIISLSLYVSIYLSFMYLSLLSSISLSIICLLIKSHLCLGPYHGFTSHSEWNLKPFSWAVRPYKMCPQFPPWLHWHHPSYPSTLTTLVSLILKHAKHRGPQTLSSTCNPLS